MKVNPFIFRAYDIRGVYPQDINEEVFQKIGFVLGKKEKKFVVGQDIRKSGQKLSEALISGLKAKKSKVFFVGKGSFGLVLFSGFKKKADFTLFVSASHLPSEWNGLKIFKGDGEPISPQGLAKKVLKVPEIKFKKIKIKKTNLKKDYLKFLFQKFSFLEQKKLKVVIDCGGGSTSLVVPQLFRKLGFKTIEIFFKPDPSFSKRDPEPTPEATKKLKKKVIKERADFGVAFDGDGDRGVIVDDRGKYLRGDQVGIILSKEMLKESRRKKIIKTVSCTMAVEEELEKMGAEIIEVPVGHTFVGKKCKKEKALLGIEESSHLFFPQIFLFDDAILTPLKIAEVLIKTKKKLSQLVDEIPIYPFQELNFSCPDEVKFKVVEKLKKDFKRKYKKVNVLDGIKVYFHQAWILIRPSNTSPKIKLYIEAKNQKTLKLLKDKFSNILSKCIQQFC
jgi:phosphomannomutase